MRGRGRRGRATVRGENDGVAQIDPDYEPIGRGWSVLSGMEGDLSSLQGVLYHLPLAAEGGIYEGFVHFDLES
jgi:hypothetical protein